MLNQNLPTALVLEREKLLRHDTGHGHPESPQKIQAIIDALDASGEVERCRVLPSTIVDESYLELVHTRRHIEDVKTAFSRGLRSFTADTPISEHSYDTARLAAGSVKVGIDAVFAEPREVKNAFCVVRPPGHHSGKDFAMGFCLFNNVALGAYYALERYGLSRIFILDWDVHHGNGTQDCTYEDPRVFFCSIHSDTTNYYPQGSGFAKEIGSGEGVGYNVNIPMRPGSGDLEYREKLQRTILPLISKYKPELTLISAGFDARRDDPLGNMRVSDEFFAEMTESVLKTVEASGAGKVVSVLEGGYHLQNVGRSVCAHVQALRKGPA